MPLELVDADTQVAGNHAHGRMAKQSPCGTWFYKPHVAGDARSAVEFAFYADVSREAKLDDDDDDDDAVPRERVDDAVPTPKTPDDANDAARALRAFVCARIPRCPASRASKTRGRNETFGTSDGFGDGLDVDGYLRLKNLTFGYARPCVIDLKIGVRTWDGKHSAEYLEKRAKSEAGTTHETLGFKVCGAQTYDASGALQRLSRDECKRIRMSEALTKETLENFVRDPATGERNAWFWPALLKQLLSEPLRALSYRLVGTSLLVVYESGRLAPSEIAGAVCVPESKLEARYIDFCHAVRKCDGEDVDNNFEGGLKLFQRFVESM
jgi:1D-myo-inositol-tetrakisphosphate 5-kinase/inositol-polyphosphate multikinase